MEIEYCNYTCADFIKDISELPIIEIEKYIDILFFQIIYTIISVQEIYPYFAHNDLFVRNVLGYREKDNGNFYTYTLNGKEYYIPQKRFFPKISDFGMTNLSNKLKNSELYKSNRKDIYNFIIDVYDGGNLGSISLMELLKTNTNKIQNLKKYFKTFFNVDVFDEYKLNSGNNIDWDWDNILDDEYAKSIDFKDPIFLLDTYFYNIFGNINKNIKNFGNSDDK